MKVLFTCPDWKNRWIPYIQKELSRYDLTFTQTDNYQEFLDLSASNDLLVSGWLDGSVVTWTKLFPKKKIISWCRRYELFESNYMKNIRPEHVNAFIFVSNYWKRMFSHMCQMNIPEEKLFVIYNAIDLDQFPLRQERAGSKKIAMICQMKDVKNFPLAFQILMNLPEEYTIYHVGLPHNDYIIGQLVTYAHHLGLLDKRFFKQGTVSNGYISKWLEDKDYLLSTSINEGNPNNVMEAMARGIKPVIHNWPGAKEQFPGDLVFDKVDEAVQMITAGVYEPERYRAVIERDYSPRNFEQLHQIIEKVMN